jgi:hypothetical protein
MRNGRGNASTRRKLASVPLCPPQIPHDPTWDRNRAAVNIRRQLTTRAMVRPGFVSITRPILEFLSSWVHEFMRTFLNTRSISYNWIPCHFTTHFLSTSLIWFWYPNSHRISDPRILSILNTRREQIHILMSEYPEHRYNVSPIIPISCPVLSAEGYVRMSCSRGGWHCTRNYLERLLKNVMVTYGQQVPLWRSTGSNRTPSSTFLYNNRSVCTSNIYRSSFMLHGVYELRRKHHYSADISVFISHTPACGRGGLHLVQYAGPNGKSNCYRCHVPYTFLKGLCRWLNLQLFLDIGCSKSG